MFVYVTKVENPKIKITVFTNFMLCLLIIASLINAILLGTDNPVWIIFIEGFNLTCSIIIICLLVMFCLNCVRLINLVEDLSKRKILNACIFIFCLIQISLFPFFAYTLLLQGYESRFLIVSALLIFSTFSCRMIIVGSIFMLFAISVNMCYTCYQCTHELVDTAANSC
jgi:hypothetical protein